MELKSLPSQIIIEDVLMICEKYCDKPSMFFCVSFCYVLVPETIWNGKCVEIVISAYLLF